MSIDLPATVTPSLSERVAEEIRALMARQRKRQSELARALGVSEQWVSVRMRGVQPIDLNDLERIASFLDVEATDLLPARRTPITDPIPARRDGHVVASRPAHETHAFTDAPIVQSKAPMPARPKGGVRPADNKLRVPPSSRRPARVKSTVRTGGRAMPSADRPTRDISTVANLMDVS